MSRLKFQVGDYGKLDYYNNNSSILIFKVVGLNQTEGETIYRIKITKIKNWEEVEKKKYSLDVEDELYDRCVKLKSRKELVIEML